MADNLAERISSSIDQIIKNLGQNKVTVDIKQNNMNEMDVFREGGEFMNAFSNFQNIFENFKDMKPNTVKVNYTPNGISSVHTTSSSSYSTVIRDVTDDDVREKKMMVPLKKVSENRMLHKSKVERTGKSKDVINDMFLYQIAFYVDKTLSLFKVEDINKKVDEFRKSLLDNLQNSSDAYKKLKFKGQKMTMDDVKESMYPSRKDVKPALYYACHIMKKNMIYEVEDRQYIEIYDKTDDTYLYFRDTTLEIEERTGFNSVTTTALETKIKNIDKQKLKKMLMKELKDLALELNIDLTKTVEGVEGEDGKKKPLLKEELIEKISSLINRST